MRAVLEHLDTNTIVKPADSVSWSCIDDEAILLNLNNGFYYTLNEVGCEVWKLVNEQRTIREIGIEMCQIYDVDQQQIEQDIWTLFQEMQQEELIGIVS